MSDQRTPWRRRCGRVGAALLLVTGLLACSSGDEPPWPDLSGGPEPQWVDVVLLEPVPGQTDLDPHNSRYASHIVYAEDGRLRPDVVVHRYPNLTLGIAQSSSGVDVFHLPAEQEFFLFEDHMMGHLDSLVGPFRGDPRIVLETAIRS